MDYDFGIANAIGGLFFGADIESHFITATTVLMPTDSPGATSRQGSAPAAAEMNPRLCVSDYFHRLNRTVFFRLARVTGVPYATNMR